MIKKYAEVLVVACIQIEQRKTERNVKKKKMDSLIKHIESNAAKYNGSKNNLKERFINVCNKDNELVGLYTENEIKMFKLVMDVVKSHEEFMDSLPSVKPIPIK